MKQTIEISCRQIVSRHAKGEIKFWASCHVVKFSRRQEKEDLGVYRQGDKQFTGEVNFLGIRPCHILVSRVNQTLGGA